MKKSVVIIIGVIYALSIVIVTLFGLNFQTFNTITYVTQVDIIDENANSNSDGMKYVSLSPDEEGKREYQLAWKVTPDNATNKSVSFDYDTSKAFVSIDENGLVTFAEPGVITVTVKATDGTSCSDKIKIYFR